MNTNPFMTPPTLPAPLGLLGRPVDELMRTHARPTARRGHHVWVGRPVTQVSGLNRWDVRCFLRPQAAALTAFRPERHPMAAILLRFELDLVGYDRQVRINRERKLCGQDVELNFNVPELVRDYHHVRERFTDRYRMALGLFEYLELTAALVGGTRLLVNNRHDQVHLVTWRGLKVIGILKAEHRSARPRLATVLGYRQTFSYYETLDTVHPELLVLWQERGLLGVAALRMDEARARRAAWHARHGEEPMSPLN